LAFATCTPEDDLLALDPVRITPGWLDRRRVRVRCAVCAEGINYEREVSVDGRPLCRSCSGHRYYALLGGGRGANAASSETDEVAASAARVTSVRTPGR
jgi:hypothetical protein